MTELERTLRELVERAAPSGHEGEVAAYIKARAEARGMEATVDPLGNVVCRLNSRPRGPRVAVFAHMDEIGLVVRKIEDTGFLRVVRSGGIEEKSLAGKEVLVITERGERIPGVIGIKAHHLVKPEEKYAVTKVEDIYIDIGTESGEETRRLGIEVGCPVVFSRTFIRREQRVFANSLDDRGGCAVLLGVLDAVEVGELRAEVYLVWSVQEEFSLRGILPAVRSIDPDLLVCLDIAPACDTPDLEGYSDVVLGGGPTVNLYTFHGRGTLAGLIPSRPVVSWVLEVAEEAGIPLQRNVFFGGLTDISFAQLEHGGIPAVDLGFAVRYAHSPVEVCDLRDLERLKDLVLALLYRAEEGVIRRLHTGR
ncbi:MAG TPA: M42 family peptidase [Candidatus Acetothermia bacterium]|nr:M42 family peptidase [Candidatus Acetothermia bacterium]